MNNTFENEIIVQKALGTFEGMKAWANRVSKDIKTSAFILSNIARSNEFGPHISMSAIDTLTLKQNLS